MIDDWEDFEIENIVIPILHVPNKEQIKRLEERKLIEESEIALMKDFFDNNSNTNSKTNNNETTENKKNTPKISKQKENELKQKELSEKIRKKKEKEKKHAELYGECTKDKYDKYDKYDDKTF